MKYKAGEYVRLDPDINGCKGAMVGLVLDDGIDRTWTLYKVKVFKSDVMDWVKWGGSWLMVQQCNILEKITEKEARRLRCIEEL